MINKTQRKLSPSKSPRYIASWVKSRVEPSGYRDGNLGLGTFQLKLGYRAAVAWSPLEKQGA